jgi:large subunit ribosomal protein L17
MRHRRSIPKLGVKTAHRKAMLSNMATSLINHGQIETTIGRAKVLAPVVSRLVTLAKRGDIHARRLAATTVKDKTVLKKLFGEVATDLKNKNGGYTRIVRSGFRKGDGASLAIIQLLIEKKVEEKETKKDKEDKKKTKTPAAKTESKKAAE